MGVLDQLVADDEDEKTVSAIPAPEAISAAPPKSMSVLDQLVTAQEEQEEEPEEINETAAITAQKNIEDNSAVREAAVRFVQDRLGMTNITDPDVAMEEYIEHFRSFNVNEITAGGDYRYVSAAAADATETP